MVNVEIVLGQQPPTPDDRLRNSDIQGVQQLMDFSETLEEFLQKQSDEYLIPFVGQFNKRLREEA